MKLRNSKTGLTAQRRFGMEIRRGAWFAAAILFVLLSASSRQLLYAQTQNGTITGTVNDPAGAVVPGAKVTLTSKDTGLVLTATSGSNGSYSFPQLIPGTYTVTVEGQGFQRAVSTLDLSVGQVANLNIPLAIGSGAETVEVNATSAATLDTDTSNLDYLVQSKQVNDLPLNGRNPYGLASLAPGIAPGSSFGVGVAVARGAVVAAATNNFESNGGLGGSNEILLDGVSIVVCCQGQPAVTPSVEFINQFKVVTNNPPAQYGRTSGAVLNIASKSGTNAFHGDIYDFLRNDKLDAANYFTKRSGIYPYPGHSDFRLPHRANQFGALVSGPVYLPKLYNGKDRTFFTFNYEGIRNFAPTSAITTVPTALMRQGIFTEGATIYNPTSSNSTSTPRTPIPAATCNGTVYAAGQCIPTSTWDPVATAYLKFVPAPNLAGTTNNLVYVSGITDTADQYNFRIDQAFGAQHRIFLRGTKDEDTHINADLMNSYTNPTASKQPLGAYLFALGDVYTINTSTVLQLTYGFARQTNLQIGQDFGNYSATDYGFSSNFGSEQQTVGLPYATFTSLPGATVGSNSSFNNWSHYVHSLNGTLILQKGSHALTIGYNGKFILENQRGLGNGIGNPSFGTNFTGASVPGGAVAGAQAPFAAWASFLLGYPTGGSLIRQTVPAFNQWWNGVYVQDDWRVTPSLTLNLGLRYDLETGFKERHNNWGVFGPTLPNPLPGVTGGVQFLGVNGNPSRTWKMSTNEWSPRVGFAYSATPKTVIRGGGGILFLPTSERGYNDPNIGFSQTTNLLTTATGYTPAAMTENYLPNGVLLPAGPAAGTGVSNGTSISGFEYQNPPSYQEQWNLGVEQSIGNTFTLNVNYAGGHGVHLPFNERLNDLQPQYFGPVGSPTTTSPYYNPATAAAINALTAQVTNPFYGKPGVANGVLTNPTVQQVQLDAKYPQYTSGAITTIANSSVGISYQDIGYSNYNALQTTLLIHRPGGVSGSVSYVWSKLLGDVSDITNGFLNSNGNPAVQDLYFLNYEYSVLATDIRHRIVGTATWDIPFGHGKRFGGKVPAWLNLAAGGWELTTIADVSSGLPLSPTVTGTTQFAGTRPMIVPGVNPQTTGGYNHRLGGTGVGQTQAYLNPAAFALPLSFQLGNAPRSWDKIRGPLLFDDNLSVIKQFPIHENLGIEFRAEAFNVFNMVEFGLPNAQFNSSTFGQITTQANLPRNIQLALKLHF